MALSLRPYFTKTVFESLTFQHFFGHNDRWAESLAPKRRSKTFLRCKFARAKKFAFCIRPKIVLELLWIGSGQCDQMLE